MQLLVDDRWKPAEIEPEVAATGRHEALPIGPTVELFPANGNGHAPAPVNGVCNGRQDEAEES